MICPCMAGALKNYSDWQTSSLLARLELWADSWYHEHKVPLFWAITGQVLEIGAGTGSNFQYYPPGTEVIAVEPNPFMHAHLERKAQAHRIRLRIISTGAENIPLPSQSIQNVVGTLVLCSVNRPESVIREIERVMVVGGGFHFIEHIQGRGMTRAFQNMLYYPWQWLFSGCKLNRDPRRIMSDFDSLTIQAAPLELGPRWLPIRPHLIGRAIKVPAS